MDTRTSQNQPITRHPLFPGIVALWFGALFGLGSLAVRVSLVESLVISSHIDSIVPQAAPPLGMTARILLATLMAVIGGVLGGRIGRWIAQPRTGARERRRGAQPARTANPAKAQRRESDRAPAAETGANDDDAAPAASAPAGRRRALAVEESMARPDYVHDAAPLPGSQPQILDVTEFDFVQADAGHLPMVHEPAELDLRDFPSQELAVAAARPVSAAPAPTALPSEEAGVGEEAAMPAGESFETSVAEEEESELVALRNSAKQLAIETGPDFDSAPVTLARHFDGAAANPPVMSQAPFAAPAFGANAPASPSIAEPARLFAAPVEPAAGPLPFAAPMEHAVAAQPFAAPVEHAATAQPFAPPVEHAVAAQPFAAPLELAVEAQPFAPPAAVPAAESPLAVAQAYSPPPQAAPADVPQSQPTLPRLGGSAQAIEAEPVAAFAPPDSAGTPAKAPVEEPGPMEFAIAPVTQPEAPQPPQPPFQQPGAAPVSRIVTADLGELSPVELIERMALSLQRRRAKLAVSDSATMPVSGTTILAAALPVAPPPQAPDPVAFQPLADEPAIPAPEAAVAHAAPAAPPGLALPAALRPIDFAEYEEEEDSSGYLPPRSISMPAPALAPAPVEPAVAVAAVFAPPFPAEAAHDSGLPAETEAEGEEEGVAEEGYSSLLDIGRPTEQRQQFVRIEEPEAESDTVEPVVIFPGRSARAENRFDAPAQLAPRPLPVIPAMDQTEGLPAIRRFATPSGQSDGSSAAQPRDPAETERALRSALATLQRMSGAA